MPQCCFAGCHNRTDDGKGLSFFRFPRRDPTRFASWIKACGRINFQPSEHSRICSNHFSTEDFERDFRSELLANAPRRLRLRDNAIPTAEPVKTPWPELDRDKLESQANLKVTSAPNNSQSMDRKRQMLSRPDNESFKRRVTDADVLDLSKKSDSVVHDVSGQGALDLSRKEDAAPVNKGDMDVICLSDDDEEELAKIEAELGKDLTNGGRGGSSAARLFLRRLANDLRNEEARLLLLRKMKASQNQLQSHHHGNGSSGGGGQLQSAAANAARSGNQGRPQPQGQHQQGGMQARGGNISSNQSGGQQTANQINRLPRPQGNHHQTAPPAHGHMSSTAINQKSALGQGQVQQQHSGRNSDAASNNSANVVSQPPAVRVTRTMALHVLEQRLTAKKTLLRKETEKALLEISSPCPTQTELSFIPSIATNEFVALVGMEEVVKSIQENDKILKGGKVKDISYTITPFSCVQCGTDFTPLWKRDRSGGSNVICEACLCSSQRTSIQKEYTDKIKQVLKKTNSQEKTLQKEYNDVANNPTELAKFQREQERQLQAQQPRPVPTNQSTVSQQQSSVQRSAGGGVITANHHQASSQQQRGSLSLSGGANQSPVNQASRHQIGGNSSSSVGFAHSRNSGNLVQQSAGNAVKSSMSSSGGSRSSLQGSGGQRVGGSQSPAQSHAAAQQAAAQQQSQSARNASLAAVAQAQAQAALMNLNLFQPQGLGGLSTDYRQQQYMQQALLQQIALLQSQPQATYAAALATLSNNGSYLNMLQNWAAAGSAANASQQLGGAGSAGKQGKK